MDHAEPSVITFDMMRQSLYAAVVCDVLDAAGYDAIKAGMKATEAFRKFGEL